MTKRLLILLTFYLNLQYLNATTHEQAILDHIARALSVPHDRLSVTKLPAGVSNQVFKVWILGILQVPQRDRSVRRSFTSYLD